MDILDLLEEKGTGKAIVFQSVADLAIDELKRDYLPLVVSGVDDKEGCKVVNEARKHIKKLRTGLEAERKKKKAKSLEYGRNLDGEAKRLSTELVEIESHLMAQEKIVTDEIARKKAEEQKIIEDKHKQQIIEIIDAGAHFDGVNYVHGVLTISDADIWNFTDEQFDKTLQLIKKIEAELKEKMAEESRLIKIEEEKQAKIDEEKRKEQDKIAKEQEEAQAKIDADKKELEEREAKILAAEKKIEDDKKAKEKAEKDKIDKKLRDDRAEALKTDKEKLKEFVLYLGSAAAPYVENEESRVLLNNFLSDYSDFLNGFQDKIKQL